MPRHKTEHDPRKQSIYLPGDILEELRTEAERTDRSLSWLLQRAWMMSRDRIKKIPSAEPL